MRNFNSNTSESHFLLLCPIWLALVGKGSWQKVQTLNYAHLQQQHVWIPFSCHLLNLTSSQCRYGILNAALTDLHTALQLLRGDPLVPYWLVLRVNLSANLHFLEAQACCMNERQRCALMECQLMLLSEGKGPWGMFSHFSQCVCTGQLTCSQRRHLKFSRKCTEKGKAISFLIHCLSNSKHVLCGLFRWCRQCIFLSTPQLFFMKLLLLHIQQFQYI